MNRKGINKIIISGGGTGGHIFPALSIAKEVRRRYPNAEILFVGAEGRMEMERVPQEGFEIVGLPVEGLQRKRIWKNVGILWKFLKSWILARDVIREFAPEVVVGVGGYASAPTLKAAQTLGIPTLIQEQNSYAGMTNKWLARRADCICVAYPNMEKFFVKRHIVLTGNPIRLDIEKLSLERAEALAHFGFDERVGRVVLVLGGSLGARTINESIARYLPQWEESGIALIWQTGKHYIEEAKRLLTGYKGAIHCADFIGRMDLAYLLADLVISRAGASTISELCLLGKSSILVPSPNVAEDHQTKNAEALSSRQAAILIPDSEARDRLSSEAIGLVNDEDALRKISLEISKFALPNATEKVVDEIEKLIK